MSDIKLVMAACPAVPSSGVGGATPRPRLLVPLWKEEGQWEEGREG